MRATTSMTNPFAPIVRFIGDRADDPSPAWRIATATVMLLLGIASVPLMFVSILAGVLLVAAGFGHLGAWTLPVTMPAALAMIGASMWLYCWLSDS